MQQIAIMEREGAPLRFQLEGDYNADDIGAAVDALIMLLDKRFAPFDPDEPMFNHGLSDLLPGDPDDQEPDVDQEAGAYVEWHTKPRVLHKWGEFAVGHEDDEDADPAEDDDPGEDDDSDRCEAGDDHMIAGAVALNDFWTHRRGFHTGADRDHESSGDEGGYSEGLPHR
jgi:hypothetical protein